MMLDVTVRVMPHVKAGKLRALLVTGQCTARAAAVRVPFDSLFPGLGIPGWHGIFATGGAQSRFSTSSPRTSARCSRSPP